MFAGRCQQLIKTLNISLNNVSKHLRLNSPRAYATTTTKEKEADELAMPVKYSASPARHWKAETSRVGFKSDRLWYEPYVIMASLSIFLIYFTILREENDIDQELSKTLYSRIEGLEEHQLRVSLEYNRDHNLDTSSIIRRLKEIEEEKANARK